MNVRSSPTHFPSSLRAIGTRTDAPAEGDGHLLSQKQTPPEDRFNAGDDIGNDDGPNRASDCRRDVIDGRWVIITRHRRRRREVVVEPDCDAQAVVVVTACSSADERDEDSHLEITDRRAGPVAVYLYLPRSARDRRSRTQKVPGGLVIDFARGGKPIGTEITAPGKVSAAAVHRALTDLDFSPIRQADLAPLRAASEELWLNLPSTRGRRWADGTHASLGVGALFSVTIAPRGKEHVR